ncbi:MAG: 50S ribosomal protein L29 [Patescibacteria group bacterium]|jgi:large subunit ribosomal protein L29|nr:50S ribosomal protein L29 [bacterium]HQC49969.1 50S ribosomal protein L29 [bacterium]
MDKKELLTKDIGELNKLLIASQEKLRDLRFKDSNKQLKNIREIRAVRRLIAQILTIINKKK